MSLQFGLQLWSVRDECARDFLGTLASVRRLGYDGVEFAGFHGVEAAAVVKVLSATGLKPAGSHAGWATLQPETIEATIAYHREIGCEWLIVPGIPQEKRSSHAACLDTATEMTAIHRILEANGMRSGYHCHEADMRPMETGERPWDLIAHHTPSTFILQYDTSNGMHGGADPVLPIREYPGRGQSIHFKEYSGVGGTAVIGEGEVPWDRVFEACYGPGSTEWGIVEHEQYGNRTPMECVRLCIEWLRSNA